LPIGLILNAKLSVICFFGSPHLSFFSISKPDTFTFVFLEALVFVSVSVYLLFEQKQIRIKILAGNSDLSLSIFCNSLILPEPSDSE
jgi:hypothetical protein